MKLPIGRRAYLEEAEEEEVEEEDDDEEDSCSLLECPFFFFFLWALMSTSLQSETTHSRRQWWSPARLHKGRSEDKKGKAAERGQRDTCVNAKHERGKVTRNRKG